MSGCGRREGPAAWSWKRLFRRNDRWLRVRGPIANRQMTKRKGIPGQRNGTGEEEGSREHGQRCDFENCVVVGKVENERRWLHRQEVGGLHTYDLLRNLYLNLRASETLTGEL